MGSKTDQYVSFTVSMPLEEIELGWAAFAGFAARLKRYNITSDQIDFRWNYDSPIENSVCASFEVLDV